MDSEIANATLKALRRVLRATEGGTRRLAAATGLTPSQLLVLREIDAGDDVTPGVVALLAAAGIAEVAVHRRPRVAVFSTGDELVPLGTTPGFGQIVDSNQVMLGEMVRAAGAELVHSGHLPDDRQRGDRQHRIDDAGHRRRLDRHTTSDDRGGGRHRVGGNRHGLG